MSGEAGAPRVIGFGCRLNLWESEVIRLHLAASGSAGRTVVVNSCAVTAEAERQTAQTIRRLKREEPNLDIVVTGCAVEVSPERFGAMPEVARIVPNAVKTRAESWGAPADPEGDRLALDGMEGRTRAILQVQQGCDHRCTFCVIPLGRGPSVSVPAGEVVHRARCLVEGGAKEIVLTGVDLTAWGADLPGGPTLGGLCRRVLKFVPDLPRLRLSSVDPVEIDDDLWRLLGEDARLMPYLHLSVQAGSDLILKRMRRRHLRSDVMRLAEKARAARPEIAFGADLIAGFPTETDRMFEETLRLVEEAGLTYLHVFAYSIRPGTPAARMPQVDPSIRKERAARLRALGETMLARHAARLAGQEQAVLVEKGGRGRTPCFMPVEAAAPAGTLATMRLTLNDDGRLLAA